MSGPLPVMSLDKIREALGMALADERVKRDPKMSLISLSLGEYLKDAERWAYVRDYEIPAGMLAKETTAYVDQQLKEVNDGVERVIRARQRREDGVSGSSGTGNAPDPIV